MLKVFSVTYNGDGCYLLHQSHITNTKGTFVRKERIQYYYYSKNTKGIAFKKENINSVEIM